jgi:hypothetical protein
MKNTYTINPTEKIVTVYAMWGYERKEIIIDWDDLAMVRSIPGTWGIKWNPTAHTFYARYQGGGKKGRYLIYMHRMIMEVTDSKIQIDHADHNGLNNRRTNLSAVSVMQNGFNRRGAQTNAKSGLRNVYWNARERKWMVWLVHLGKRYYIGYFEDIHAADEAARKLRLSLGGHS